MCDTQVCRPWLSDCPLFCLQDAAPAAGVTVGPDHPILLSFVGLTITSIRPLRRVLGELCTLANLIDPELWVLADHALLLRYFERLHRLGNAPGTMRNRLSTLCIGLRCCSDEAFGPGRQEALAFVQHHLTAIGSVQTRPAPRRQSVAVSQQVGQTWDRLLQDLGELKQVMDKSEEQRGGLRLWRNQEVSWPWLHTSSSLFFGIARMTSYSETQR